MFLVETPSTDPCLAWLGIIAYAWVDEAVQKRNKACSTSSKTAGEAVRHVSPAV